MCSVVSNFNGQYGHEGVGTLGGTEQSAYDINHNVYVSYHIVQLASCRGYSYNRCISPLNLGVLFVKYEDLWRALVLTKCKFDL